MIYKEKVLQERDLDAFCSRGIVELIRQPLTG